MPDRAQTPKLRVSRASQTYNININDNINANDNANTNDNDNDSPPNGQLRAGSNIHSNRSPSLKHTRNYAVCFFYLKI